MDSVQTVPQSEVAEGSHMGYAKRAAAPRRPRVLKKGSAATKRWMAHLRSLRKSSKKAASPKRGRKTPARRGRKPGPKKGSRKAAKTPMRRGRKPASKKGSRKGSRKASPKRK